MGVVREYRARAVQEKQASGQLPLREPRGLQVQLPACPKSGESKLYRSKEMVRTIKVAMAANSHPAQLHRAEQSTPVIAGSPGTVLLLVRLCQKRESTQNVP